MINAILSLWNRLDALLRPVAAPEFQYQLATNNDGEKIFIISGLKVWLYREDCTWIAQGLDIGFTASGESIEDAESRFMRGLFATIDINLRQFGSIDNILRPADPGQWIAWRRAIRHANASGRDRRDPPRPSLFNDSSLDPLFYLPAA